MLDRLESLGLDAGRIRRQRDVAAGIARMYAGEGQSPDRGDDRKLSLIAAGTNFRRAAANSLLLGESSQAMRHFAEAASAYVAAGAAYGYYIANLSDRPPTAEVAQEHGPENVGSVFLLWSPLSAETRLGNDDQDRSLRDALDGYRTERLGVLGLPAGVYLDLFDSVVAWRRDRRPEVIEEALLPLLGPYSVAVRLAKRDQYHWSRLAAPFHPAEPDVLGVLVVLHRILAAKNSSLTSLVTSLPLGQDALELLGGALGQYDAWRAPG